MNCNVTEHLGLGYIRITSFKGRMEIADEFDQALEALKNTDIRVALTDIAIERRVAFRRLVGIIIKLNSLRMRTYRKLSTNCDWLGELLSYELADLIRKYMKNSSFSNVIL